MYYKLSIQLPIIIFLGISISSLSQIKEETLPLQLSKIQGKWISERDDGGKFYKNIVGNYSYYPGIKDNKKIDSSYYAFCDDCFGIGNSDYDMSRLKINNESGSFLMVDSTFCYEFGMADDELSYVLIWTYRHNIFNYKRVNAMHLGAKRGIIKAEKSIIYTLPDKEKPMKKYLVRYDEIEVLGRQGAFTQIKFYGKLDIIGWIQTEDIWK